MQYRENDKYAMQYRENDKYAMQYRENDKYTMQYRENVKYAMQYRENKVEKHIDSRTYSVWWFCKYMLVTKWACMIKLLRNYQVFYIHIWVD